MPVSGSAAQERFALLCKHAPEKAKKKCMPAKVVDEVLRARSRSRKIKKDG